MIVWMTEQSLNDAEVVNKTGYDQLSDQDYQFYFRDLKGNTKRLDEYRGEVIFINFWATWCTPCIAEMGSLTRLYKKHKNNVKFFFISFEEDNVIKKFRDSEEYKIPMYKGLGGSELFKIQSWPTTMIISKSGELVVFDRGAKQWDSDNIHKLLKRLVKE